jgi:hypothetical protein
MKITSTTGIVSASVLFVVVLIGAAVWQNVKPSQLNEFAQCLNEKGAVVYEAWWCPHCQNQKALFGSAARYLNTVECGAARGQLNTALCPDVQATPTWRGPDGLEIRGSQPLSVLADSFECALPENYEG